MADKSSFLPVDSLQANPLQPRGVITPDSLTDLIESVKVHGIIEPIVVAHTPAGYQIIAGERRWRAARAAGLSEVPVLIKETTPRGMLEMAIVENVQRTDLNALDRAKSFERLMSEFNLSLEEIAARLGKSRPYISNSLRMLNLPDALKDGLISGVITEGHARALLGIEDKHQMVEAYKQILRENGSVRMAEELARRMRLSVPEVKGRESVNEFMERRGLMVGRKADETERELEELLGRNSKVTITRSTRNTAINIVLRGDQNVTEKKTQRIITAIKYINKKAIAEELANEQKKEQSLSVAAETVVLD
jgi:ParB family transcriptional regulator, chromosome partitioning protein